MTTSVAPPKTPPDTDPADDPTEDNPTPVRRRWVGGLSSKLLLLTISFVMLSEVLIFVPSIANFRNNWLHDRLSVAAVASIVVSSHQSGEIPRELQDELLASTEAIVIAVRDGEQRWLVAMAAMPPAVDVIADIRDMNPLSDIRDTFGALLAPDGRILRIIGNPPQGDQVIEIVVDETPLRAAMFGFGRNILILSLIISMITATLVFLSLRALFVRPMQKITRSMVAFREDPEDPDRIIEPSARTDEIGVAERQLASMERDLTETLKERRHLADLGMAVSKINHDLRNILASAQLFSDRLSMVPDPSVQRLTPKIIGALDRAIDYTQSVMAYGGAKEAPPDRRLVSLARLADDVAEILALPDKDTVEWENRVDPGLEIDADPDQMFRVLLNLTRNAVQALEGDPRDAVIRRLWIAGERHGAEVLISVADTGPGVPDRAKAHLFQAFQGSVRPGGTGLGLAIAAELVRAHGGAIRLCEETPGAQFEIRLPDRPINLSAARRARQK